MVGPNLQVTQGANSPLPPQRSGKSSKALKVFGALAGIGATALLVLGALGIAGGASLGLLVSGAVVLGVLAIVMVAAVVKGVVDKKKAAALLEKAQAERREQERLLAETQQDPEVPEDVENPGELEQMIAGEYGVNIQDLLEAQKKRSQQGADSTGPEPILIFPGLQGAANRAQEGFNECDLEKLPEFSWEDNGLSEPKTGELTDYYRYFLQANKNLQAFLGCDEDGKPYYPDTPEGKAEFLKLARKQLYAAALVTTTALKELPQWLNSGPGTESYLDILSNSNGHFQYTFFSLPDTYLFVRHLHSKCSQTLTEEEQINAESRFYRGEHDERHFREMFNDFCTTARECIGRDPEVAKNDREKELFSNSEEDRGPLLG
ncbi:hypothetical protein [Chlamydia vaughanii]|uniref:hypothetical protein n=1 Tax=Chlamydia vaughanii TaxID=3112552 RepID=UPI0032B1C651